MEDKRLNGDDFKIVVMIGPMGCGKTAITQSFLLANPGFVSVSFASLVRQVVELVYGIPEQEQKKPEVKNKVFPELGNHTLRHALQWLGTESFRALHHDTWVEGWVRQVNKLRLNPEIKGVVVDDCRFLNEFKTVEALGAYFVHIYNEEVHTAWAQNLVKAKTEINKLKVLVCSWIPALTKVLKPVRVHESELQIERVLAALLDVDHKRTLFLDNSQYDPTGKLVSMLANQVRSWLYAQR